MANTTLTFNENTYVFKLHGTRKTNDSDIVLYDGSVIIDGSVEYFLTYSYSAIDASSRACYAIFNVDDTDISFFEEYGKRDFPFEIVQYMVQHIMKQKNI